MNYNYASAIKKNEDFPGDPSYNKQMLYIPQEFFKSSLMFNYLTSSKIIKFVSLNAFYTYTGKRYMNADNTVFNPHYMLVDVNMNFGFNFFKSWNAHFMRNCSLKENCIFSSFLYYRRNFYETVRQNSRITLPTKK